LALKRPNIDLLDTQKNPIHDAMTRNAFNRFKKGLLVHFSEPAEALDDDELAKLYNYEDALEFIRTTQEGLYTCGKLAEEVSSYLLTYSFILRVSRGIIGC
jgi:hypothetical protein